MKYTVGSKEVIMGSLLPSKRRTVIKYCVLDGENVCAYVDTKEEAEKVAALWNAEEAAYRKMVEESGLTEWEFLDQNSPG